MQPYFEEDGITIYHGDCRDVLSTLKHNSVDLVLTDPPFFMPATHYQSRVQWQRSWSDTSILASFWATVLDGVCPVLRPTGHLLTFCNGDSYPVFYPELYRRFDYMKSLVWDKGHVGLGRIWRNQHELIIAARWNESVFIEDGKLRADVLQVPATASASRDHPVQKPVQLLSMLIEPTVPMGGVVLDPFMGSGTTLQAAKMSGYRAIGIEGEERYCDIAAKRLSQGVMDFAALATPAPRDHHET